MFFLFVTKHAYDGWTDGWTDRETDGQTDGQNYDIQNRANPTPKEKWTWRSARVVPEYFGVPLSYFATAGADFKFGMLLEFAYLTSSSAMTERPRKP